MTSLSIFSDFPEFPFAGETCVPIVKYKGVTVEVGMWAIWNNVSQPFRIKAIRLNPTLRFWDGRHWVIAANCKIFKMPRI